MLTAIIPDVHVPFERTDALLAWLKRERPRRIVLLGDVLDLHAITEHRKDRQWADRLDRELRLGRRWFEALRVAAGPIAEITMIKGNHEARLDRFWDAKAPQFRNVAATTLPEIMGFKNLGVYWHDVEVERKGVRVPTGQGQVAYCYHGHELRSKYKGSTALAYCAAFGQNAIIGHTHRYSLEHAQVGGKVLFGIEAGYLGNPKAPAFTYAGPAPKIWRRGWLVADSEQKHNPYPKWISA